MKWKKSKRGKESRAKRERPRTKETNFSCNKDIKQKKKFLKKKGQKKVHHEKCSSGKKLQRTNKVRYTKNKNEHKKVFPTDKKEI